MKTAMVFVVVLALIVAAAPAARAGGGIHADLAESLSRLSPGQKVRLQVHPQRELTGRFSGVVGDSVVVVDEAGEHRLAQRNLAALYRGVSGAERGARRGLAAGGAVGMLGGLVVGLSAASYFENGWIVPASLGFGVGIGAGAGLIVGGLFGSLTTDWRLQYTEPSYHPAMWSDAAPGRSPSGATSTVGPVALPAGEPGRFDLRLHPAARGGVLLAATVRF